MASSVKKSTFLFSCDLQIDKKKMQKRIKGEKLIQIFFFPKLPSACEVLIRRNVI